MKTLDQISNLFAQKWAKESCLGQFPLSGEQARKQEVVRLLCEKVCGWVLLIFVLVGMLVAAEDGHWVHLLTHTAAGILFGGILAWKSRELPHNVWRLQDDWGDHRKAAKLVLRKFPKAPLRQAIERTLLALVQRIKELEKLGDYRSEKFRKRFGEVYDLAKALGFRPDPYKDFFTKTSEATVRDTQRP